jgi:hypothetical protein
MKFEEASRGKRASCWLLKIAATALVAPFLIVVFAESGSAAKRRLGVDDYLALESVGAPEISPDGKWVAYAVSSIDSEKDETTSAIWRVARAGGDPDMGRFRRYSSQLSPIRLSPLSAGRRGTARSERPG